VGGGSVGGGSVGAERFVAAMPPAVDRTAAASLGHDLVARWNESHRHYHTGTHLEAVLSIVDANARLADDLTAVRLAAWFHDAVYDPTAGDNEEASAALAVTALGLLGLAGSTVAEVARLVRMTARHDPADGDHNGCLLADADLAILATEPDVYDRYAVAVRREYAHVPDPLFRAGRATVLRKLLALPRLYRIVPARAEWTTEAHANLHRELAELGPDPGGEPGRQAPAD
jgi:predicted metal-dependent HD superfamily phosphohydrolase